MMMKPKVSSHSHLFFVTLFIPFPLTGMDDGWGGFVFNTHCKRGWNFLTVKRHKY